MGIIMHIYDRTGTFDQSYAEMTAILDANGAMVLLVRLPRLALVLSRPSKKIGVVCVQEAKKWLRK